MKSAVVYWSKTGFVEKYAEWIAEELTADLIEGDKVSLEKLEKYDSLVFGGSLYAVGINGVEFMKKVLNNEKFYEKKIAIFATGASSPLAEVIEEVKNNNFSEDEQELFKFFYLRGGFNYNRLGIKDKILMKMMKWQLEHKKKKGEKLNEEEKGLLEAFDEPVDFTKKENIEELIEYLK